MTWHLEAAECQAASEQGPLPVPSGATLPPHPCNHQHRACGPLMVLPAAWICTPRGPRNFATSGPESSLQPLAFLGVSHLSFFFLPLTPLSLAQGWHLDCAQ